MFCTEQQNSDGLYVLPPRKNRVKDSGNKNISLTDYSIQSMAFLLQPKPIRNEIKQKFV